MTLTSIIEKSVSNMPSDLTGKMLVATPLLTENNFFRALVYVCSHSENGAIGIIVNHEIHHVNYEELLKYWDIPEEEAVKDVLVYHGGPVDSERCFILYTNDYNDDDAITLGNEIAISTNVEMTKDIICGEGPRKSLLAIGYADWSSGQLEKEILDNYWIPVPATEELIFGRGNVAKWEKAAQSIGVDMFRLSTATGNA